MRLGKLSYTIAYVVDLDDEDMVQHAREAIREDLEAAYKHDEFDKGIKIDENNSDLTEDMIDSFLTEDSN